MAGERIAKLFKDQEIPKTSRTDLVYGTVTSTSPLAVMVETDSRMILPEPFLILSPLCIAKSATLNVTTTGGNGTASGTLWRGLVAGDKVTMLRVANGQKFIVLFREGSL